MIGVFNYIMTTLNPFHTRKKIPDAGTNMNSYCGCSAMGWSMFTSTCGQTTTSIYISPMLTYAIFSILLLILDGGHAKNLSFETQLRPQIEWPWIANLGFIVCSGAFVIVDNITMVPSIVDIPMESLVMKINYAMQTFNYYDEDTLSHLVGLDS